MMNYDDRGSVTFAINIIAGFQDLYALNAPVIVMFFCNNDSVVGTDENYFP